MRKLLAWLPVALYAALVFWLSSQSHPLPFLPAALARHDKLLHAGEYAVLSLLLGRALRASGLSPGRAFLAALALAAAYGATDEWHQHFVPMRTPDPWDWAADDAGAVLGGALGSRFLRLRKARASIAT